MTLSLLASRAPSSSLAPAALNEIHKLRSLWRHMGPSLPCGCRALVCLYISPLAYSSRQLICIITTQTALEKSADSSRRTYIRWRMDHAPAHVSTELPSAFAHAHGDLKQRCRYMVSVPHPPIDDMPPFTTPGQPGMDSRRSPVLASCPSPDRLPSVYNFNHTLIGKDAVHPKNASSTTRNSAHCTRVGDFNRPFNFDFGALSGDQSFMAWF